MFDGVWNLISWTYKKQLAKAIVLFNGKDVESKELKTLHYPIGDYLRFSARKEV